VVAAVCSRQISSRLLLKHNSIKKFVIRAYEIKKLLVCPLTHSYWNAWRWTHNNAECLEKSHKAVHSEPCCACVKESARIQHPAVGTWVRFVE
jgi:hypothetical protein